MQRFLPIMRFEKQLVHCNKSCNTHDNPIQRYKENRPHNVPLASFCTSNKVVVEKEKITYNKGNNCSVVRKRCVQKLDVWADICLSNNIHKSYYPEKWIDKKKGNSCTHNQMK